MTQKFGQSLKSLIQRGEIIMIRSGHNSFKTLNEVAEDLHEMIFPSSVISSWKYFLAYSQHDLSNYLKEIPSLIDVKLWEIPSNSKFYR